MTLSDASLCQRVPAPAGPARLLTPQRPIGVLALLAALACDGADSATPQPRKLGGAPAQRADTLPPPVDLHPTLPQQCPAIACEPQSFVVHFERSVPWSAGTYYIRASADGGPRRVCSVVLEPVLGAAHDTCGDELPFRVHYRYDEEEQTISAVSFGPVHAVELQVLTSEEAPPVVDVEHQLVFQYAASSGGCGRCPASPPPLQVRVAAALAGDAGSGDAGSGDAGSRAADGGFRVDAGDAGSGLEP